MGLINHIGLAVNDLQTSIDFYCDVVGMELVRRRQGPLGGEYFDTLTRNSGALIETAVVAGDGLALQLVQYHAGGNPESTAGHNRVGNIHICINVADVEAKHTQIVALGAHRPTEIVSLPIDGVRSFYVEDPDGVPIEFLAGPYEPQRTLID
jgi:catechol 2,3-dioxygenase-like lactoylglutathione lyase family enzyme